MDLRTFQRDFRAAREAADRGEIVRIKAKTGEYVFGRAGAEEVHPLADLRPYFGVVNLRRDRRLSTHETIRRRLQARRSD